MSGTRADVGERSVNLSTIGDINFVARAALGRCDVEGGNVVSVGDESICNRGTDAGGAAVTMAVRRTRAFYFGADRNGTTEKSPRTCSSGRCAIER